MQAVPGLVPAVLDSAGGTVADAARSDGVVWFLTTLLRDRDVAPLLDREKLALVADKAELESEQRALVEITNAVEHHSPFVTHSTPFFDWLAASDDEE